MTVYDTLKEEKLTARKAKDQETIGALTYLQGEIERQYKNPDDTKVITLLRSIEKKLAEDEGKNVIELGILRSFLRRNTPALMSKARLHEVLELSGAKNIGEAMKYLRDNHPNEYDPSEVASLYKKNN